MTGRAAAMLLQDQRFAAPGQWRTDTPSGPSTREPPLWTAATCSTPDGFDIEQPSASRIYDFFLGGAHNFGADRQAAEAVIATAPQIIDAARANRAFLRRAVRYALAEGIRQFLDLGSGFPGYGSVHEIVHGVDSAAPVVYVDVDPVVVALAERIVDASPAVGAVPADIRDMLAILDHPETRRLIDFSQPVCVLLTCVLHFIPDELTDTMATLRAALGPGSLLVVSHGTDPGPRHAAQSKAVRQVYAKTATPISLRMPDEIAALLTCFDLVPAHQCLDSAERPGLVAVNQWRPDTDPSAGDGEPIAPIPVLLAAVARIPPWVSTNPTPVEGSHIR